ncbi:MAG TPA: efflux RND transporter permease subunit [Gemmatimonadaceae bacterium]|nr:efflux RND transporter permease subunit [Gemmatimonadaceae bacterium]
MFLSDISIKRPVFATMMMVALLVLGLVSRERLAIDEYPDVTYPTVMAQTSYPGASPEVMERDVSRPIEEALNTVQGIREVTSTSREGLSTVRVTLQLGVDVMAAQQEVVAKIARIRRQLPPDVEDPVVVRFDPNDRPIISISVESSERSIRDLTDIAEQVIATRLEAIPGVGGVNVTGGTPRQIRVQLDPEALQSYQVSPVQVSQALARENQDVPAGRVFRGDAEKLVRVTGRIVDPKAFADVVVVTRNGVPIRVRDVGTVVDGAAEPRSAAFKDSSRAVAVEVLKISGSNTVQVADAVKQQVEELRRTLPSDIRLTVIRDDSVKIRAALDDVQLTIMLGALLTVLIIYLFLNSWRSTVITGLTLPISVISSFFAMWVFGFTINTMTLLALSLAIGLLIDDAIVVRENIVRHIEMGKDHYRASKEATDEIGLAVVSTTLAVVAVFIPVAFMGGQIGKIFFQFGVTVTAAVLVSLFVSFTLDPMLSSVWPDPEIEQGGHGAIGRRVRNPVRRMALAFDAWFERQADRYREWLKWALRRRAIIVGGAVASVVGAFLLYPLLGFTWLPEYDAGEFDINYRTAPGSRIEYTIEKGMEIAALVRKQPEVEFTYLTIGGGFMGSPNNGRIYVRLKEKGARTRSMSQIQSDLRRALPSIPGVRPSIAGTRSIFGGFGQPIRIFVQGPEPTRLKIAAEQVLRAIREVPGVAEPTSSDEGEIPQLDVRVDRQQAWAAGLGIQSIASTLQPLFQGQRATRWEDPNGYSHDVIVVYPDSVRVSPEDVARIPVLSSNADPRTGRASVVPLAQVADIKAGVGPQQIERRSLERQITISAGVLNGFNMGDVAVSAKRAIDQIGLPPGYRVEFGGDVQNLEETKGYVLEALVLAIIFIYLILASLFGSFVQPLSIMLALPLSFLGVVLALLLTSGSLNVMSMIGIVMLMGLVTKNGILLIDFVNRERERGVERTEAILNAARIRIRPIIMTTAAMIFGMIPLALAIGEGAEQRAPMAHAVIGGLITSTLLTLFVVPAVYTLLDDVSLKIFGRKPAAAPSPVLAGELADSRAALEGRVG